MADHSARSAAVLLADALGCVDRIQPPSAREPVRHMFRAAIETCALNTTLLGLPITPTLDLAQALVDDRDSASS